MFAVVLSSILPVCLLLLLGSALCRFRFLPEVFFGQMNRLGFWVLLPTLLFGTIIKAPPTAGADGLKIGALLCGCSVAVTGLAWIAARLLGLTDASARALMQAAMRGNLAYTALPVLIYAFGEGSEAAAVSAFALAPTIPFYNFWAVLILTKPQPETPGSPRTGLFRHAGRTFTTVLRNPLIIGCAAGLLLLKSGVTLPAGFTNAIDTLGRSALPCALLALGAGLTPERIRTSLTPAFAASALKLLAMPLLGLALARAFGLSGDLRLIALLYLASPCAVTSYVMADQMGADKELAGAAIALSTLACLPVMALILLAFH